VYWHKVSGKWAARITHNGRNHNLGLYASEKEVAMAYDKRAKEFYGEFAYLNFGD
jgi:hypothetical protein